MEVDGKPEFVHLLLLWLSVSTFPIVTFFVFGFKKDLFLFWKEYFTYCYKNKTITFEFVPSFDPNSTTTTNGSRLEHIQQNEIKEL